MEEKKTKRVQNVSSGAEKVERIEKTVKTENKPAEKQVKKVAKVETAQKQTPNQSQKQAQKPTEKKKQVEQEKKIKQEEKRAQKRVERALKKKQAKAEKEKLRAKKRAEREKRANMSKAERKKEAEKNTAERRAEAEKRKAERKAQAEKKKAERKAKAEKRLAERKAREERRKAEAEARRREHAHAKANRRQEKNKTRQKKESRNKERKENRGGKKGYGGWLAAVIALGTVTLGLTTAVTVGAIEMKGMKNTAMTGIQSTTYELTGIMEHVDDDLDRVRISASPVQQERILTDLLVQARLAELDLEKLPISGEMDGNLTRFINRVGAESERMLAKLRHGGKLSKEDEETLERLYKTNHTMRMQLDEYVSKMTDKDLTSFMKKGEGMFMDAINGLENLTLEENRKALGEKMKGAGMGSMTPPSKKEKTGSPKIDTAQAEELCKRYFSDYKIDEFQCVGETVARDYSAYNVQGYDDEGTMLFAEIDYNDGELIRFDYFKLCDEETFDLQNAERIALAFLEKLGYEDMTALRTHENGTDADFSFVYEADGVAYYPDTVRVKVCRTRGVVTGFDASQYLRNHERKGEIKTGVTMEEAQAKLHNGLTVEHARLAVVKAKGGERTAYEFLCSYGEEKYLVYLDAMHGEEIAIMNIKNL